MRRTLIGPAAVLAMALSAAVSMGEEAFPRRRSRQRATMTHAYQTGESREAIKSAAEAKRARKRARNLKNRVQ